MKHLSEIQPSEALQGALDKSALYVCAKSFQGARANIVQAMALLYQIEQQNLWEGEYSSFTEYVETACQISRGYASKLLQTWKYFVIDGAVSPRNLETIDSEKLYMAMKLPTGTPEDKLVRAQTWSRRELKDELNEKDGQDCKHPESGLICFSCHKRI